ncbi:transposase [Synergistaceae bacterium OttesenSCG-928-D05]|nr:transposase [Synergistaceae bacterium OttesenSCG-928-D05]
MGKRDKHYDEEFKKNAVRLSYTSDRGLQAIADDLGIDRGNIYRWRKIYTQEGNKTPLSATEEENRALRKENNELRIELDMLKKAAAYFAKNQK